VLRKRLLFSVLAVVASALAALSVPASTQAEVVQHVTFTITTEDFSACTSEPVAGELRTHFLITSADTPSGQVVFNGHVHQQFHGTGTISGDVYVGSTESNNEIIFQSVDGSHLIFQHTGHVNLVRRGESEPADDFVLIGVTHVTINQHGQVDHVEFRTECR
jgi:hypothetical protein